MTQPRRTALLTYTEMMGVKAPVWQPYPYQMPPPGDWDTWLILAGRGAGKTLAGVHFVLDHLRSVGPSARVGIGAPIYADARDVCAEGATGLITIAPSEFTYNRSILEARHRDGGYVKFLSCEDPSRWNGPQWTLIWFDELALCNRESWEQAQFGLRLGPHPRALGTATPKRRKWLKELAEKKGVVVTRATTYDNPALAQRVKDRLEERYGGTSLGRQELMGEMLAEVEGALWRPEMIDPYRVVKAPECSRVMVAIDPAGTHDPSSDETGITVAGLGKDGHYYVLHCDGYRLSPHGWARKAIDLYEQYKADRIIAERNNGGEMVEATIRRVSPNVPLKTIVASRGKVVRAEPVAALYEQGKVHHVGILADLEEQMLSFPVANEYDDLVDSLVYAISELSSGGGLRIWV